MGFGTSFSLVHVDCLDWVHTGVVRRFIRGILGTAIATGIYFLFVLIPSNDNPTKFFFHFALPAMLISFFIYGLFPIICLKINLVVVQEGMLHYDQVNQIAYDRNDINRKVTGSQLSDEETDKKN
jgi:hypothetical protein